MGGGDGSGVGWEVGGGGAGELPDQAMERALF